MLAECCYHNLASKLSTASVLVLSIETSMSQARLDAAPHQYGVKETDLTLEFTSFWYESRFW